MTFTNKIYQKIEFTENEIENMEIVRNIIDILLSYMESHKLEYIRGGDDFIIFDDLYTIFSTLNKIIDKNTYQIDMIFESLED